MPSPFPGMDPFIEDQEWPDFHVRFVSALSEALMPFLAPRYVARVERRVYVEHVLEDETRFIRPDVSVLDHDGPGFQRGASDTTATLEPVVVALPIPEEQREAYLYIRDRETMEVVSIIEVLSPGNKRTGGDGRREYLSKREEVLRSATHLVELDLLRGGDRLPTKRPLPPGDYYALVCRSDRRPNADVYHWTLRARLPTIPIPLARGDRDVFLDLQTVFGTVYERAGYQYSINYGATLDPPLKEADLHWVEEVLGGN